MGNKFRARFKRKLQDGRDFEIAERVFPFTVLREGEKLKPPNTFRYKGGSYIFDPTCVSDYDRMGNPIIKYYFGNSMPIPANHTKVPAVQDSNGEYVIVDSGILDKTFSRGEMKSVIASSQKEEKKWDWQTLIIGSVLGLAIGMMIMSIIYPDIFAKTVAVGHAIIYEKFRFG